MSDLAEFCWSSNIRLLGEHTDPIRDLTCVRIELSIPNEAIDRGMLDPDDFVPFFRGGMREAIDMATRERRYDKRSRPSLGAGTCGYKARWPLGRFLTRRMEAAR